MFLSALLNYFYKLDDKFSVLYIWTARKYLKLIPTAF
jgi:hypothetical protein